MKKMLFTITYDSLCEGYMKNGDSEHAIENYRKSLEMNPQNENAKIMLKPKIKNKIINRKRGN